MSDKNRYGCNISFEEYGFEIAKFHNVHHAKLFLMAYINKHHDSDDINISLKGRSGDYPK